MSGTVVADAAALRAGRAASARTAVALLAAWRIGDTLTNAGAATLLGFGLWLVALTPYGFGDAWVIAALVLFAAQGAIIGPISGRRKRAQALAAGAADPDVPVGPELAGMLVDRRTLVLVQMDVLLYAALLTLMVWKPGA